MSGGVGQYARILVEVDFQNTLQESVMIDRGEKSFFVELTYENLPMFCSSCKQVGHETTKCRKYVGFKDNAALGDKDKTYIGGGDKGLAKKLPDEHAGGNKSSNNNNMEGWQETTKMWVKRNFNAVANNSTTEKRNQFALLEIEQDNSADTEHDPKDCDQEERVSETQFQQDAHEVGDEHGSEGFLNLNSVTISKMGIGIQVLKGCSSDEGMIQRDGEDDALKVVSDSESYHNFLNSETPFVTKRRGQQRQRASREDLCLASVHNEDQFSEPATKLSPVAIAQHNMSAIAKGTFNKIIDSETGNSPVDFNGKCSASLKGRKSY